MNLDATARSGRQAQGEPVNGKILTAHAVVDNVLDTFRDALGPDAVRYRNHVYRGLNYQRMLLRLTTIPDEIPFASALHDIGIWTSGWDDIPPSVHP